ncbi:hypothetical protein F2P56_004916 [Juglans regia]|uniref:Reverse transcriptase Ty1/copia-type domain-containing protein n=1 Tax=Juglans regia TaxID=51240 RepID=A0A833Y6A7_JUGRE|nr:hypothetical protein F2P56_004916 [Juglans regia]
MDVKSAFLNGLLQEEVYVEQPKGFTNNLYLDHVYRLKKALYRLKQAPHAWYGRLTAYLLEHGFTRGQADRTLFIRKSGKNIDPTLYSSMIGSLLYITASRPDITFSVDVCVRSQANPKESHLTVVKRIVKYLNANVDYEIWYSKDTNFTLDGYSDVDWARNADDRKSNSGGCFYVGGNLVAWMSKK